jgi:rSAM/selenodomain-associated transferase 1
VSAGRALVLAKAPVAGRVKTRLGAVIGHRLAARLAAAALLDTLEACSSAFAECHLALDGSFEDVEDPRSLTAATATWQVFPQVSGELGDRLAAAHARAASTGCGPVVQIGMDTPQVTAADLQRIASRVRPGTAVLGPALDGGWWALGSVEAAGTALLAGVPMSTPHTYERTHAALVSAGLAVRRARSLRDVDSLEDARAVASAAPHTRFAATWRRAAGAA